MSDYEAKVRTIVSKIIKKDRESIGVEEDLVEKYGMDSMQRVEIVIELEKTFDISISDDAALGLRSIGKILDLVQREVIPR